MTAEDNPLAGLEYEINAEKAASLGRAGAKLEEALALLRAFDAAPPALPAVQRRAARDERVAEAAERLWYYIVQREAMGWNRHDEVLAVYDVPAEIQARMGPRRTAPPITER